MKMKTGGLEIKHGVGVLASILAVGLLSAFASFARADIITYTDIENVSVSDPAIFQPFNIPQFNPAFGTLSSVNVTISGLVQTSLAFTNWSNSSDGVMMQEQNKLLALYNNSQMTVSNAFIFRTTSYPHLQLVGANGGVYSQTWFYDLSPVVFASSHPDDLDNFTGLGNVPLAAGFVSDTYMTMSGGNYQYSVQTTASETATVTYTFNSAAPVPEPSAALLLSIGSLAICGVRGFKSRRRQR